jgi:hypothetical protein
MRAINTASSAILARVHGQRGWASMTNVARLGSRVMELCAGHCSGGVAATPAVAAYLQSNVPPAPTAPIHRAANIVHRDVIFSSQDIGAFRVTAGQAEHLELHDAFLVCPCGHEGHELRHSDSRQRFRGEPRVAAVGVARLTKVLSRCWR